MRSALFNLYKGVSASTFKIDSLMPTGTYTFLAYTNHMRDFKENTGYTQRFYVLDVEEKTMLKPKNRDDGVGHTDHAGRRASGRQYSQ